MQNNTKSHWGRLKKQSLFNPYSLHTKTISTIIMAHRQIITIIKKQFGPDLRQLFIIISWLTERNTAIYSHTDTCRLCQTSTGGGGILLLWSGKRHKAQSGTGLIVGSDLKSIHRPFLTAQSQLLFLLFLKGRRPPYWSRSPSPQIQPYIAPRWRRRPIRRTSQNTWPAWFSPGRHARAPLAGWSVILGSGETPDRRDLDPYLPPQSLQYKCKRAHW